MLGTLEVDSAGWPVCDELDSLFQRRGTPSASTVFDYPTIEYGDLCVRLILRSDMKEIVGMELEKSVRLSGALPFGLGWEMTAEHARRLLGEPADTLNDSDTHYEELRETYAELQFTLAEGALERIIVRTDRARES